MSDGTLGVVMGSKEKLSPSKRKWGKSWVTGVTNA